MARRRIGKRLYRVYLLTMLLLMVAAIGSFLHPGIRGRVAELFNAYTDPALVPVSDETRTEKALRLCRTCGLDEDEIRQMIDDIANSPLSHEEQVQLFEKTFADPHKPKDARELIHSISRRRLLFQSPCCTS